MHCSRIYHPKANIRILGGANGLFLLLDAGIVCRSCAECHPLLSLVFH